MSRLWMAFAPYVVVSGVHVTALAVRSDEVAAPTKLALMPLLTLAVVWSSWGLRWTTAQTLLLLLDGVTDPRNLGACMRTAEAAGAQAVVVPRDRSASLTPVVAAAAAGAAETLPLIAVTNLARAMEEIREAGVWIAGAAGEAERSIYDLDLTGPVAWALGAEGQGLRRLTREKCDWLARIPLHGQTESLNVSVAAGVCLFETLRQRAAGAASG